MYLLTGQVENISNVLDIVDIAGFFSPTFVNPTSDFDLQSNMKTWIAKKSEICKYPSF